MCAYGWPGSDADLTPVNKIGRPTHLHLGGNTPFAPAPSKGSCGRWWFSPARWVGFWGAMLLRWAFPQEKSRARVPLLGSHFRIPPTKEGAPEGDLSGEETSNSTQALKVGPSDCGAPWGEEGRGRCFNLAVQLLMGEESGQGCIFTLLASFHPTLWGDSPTRPGGGEFCEWKSPSLGNPD